MSTIYITCIYYVSVCIYIFSNFLCWNMPDRMIICSLKIKEYNEQLAWVCNKLECFCRITTGKSEKRPLGLRENWGFCVKPGDCTAENLTWIHWRFRHEAPHSEACVLNILSVASGTVERWLPPEGADFITRSSHEWHYILGRGAYLEKAGHWTRE